MLLFCFAGLAAISQNWQDNINRINDYTKNYDPYKRFFTYNANTGKLKWVTSDGDITCEAVLSDINVYVEGKSTDASVYVTFATKDKSKTIDCTYGGATELTAITVNSYSIAQKIVTEIKAINSGSSSRRNNNNNASDWQTRINTINSYTKTYDPYKRTFSYSPSTGKLSFITSDKDITCEVPLKDVNVYVDGASTASSVYVSFSCKDKSKCIYSSYSGNLDLTSVTINSYSIAHKILDEIQALQPSSSSTTTVSNTGGSSQSIIDKINNLCVAYDPYVRIFSYDESTSMLTWVTQDGDITCKADLNKITIASKQNTGDCSVTFSTIDGSKTIDCNYTGPVAITSITTKTLSSANQIVSLIQSLPKGKLSTSGNGRAKVKRYNYASQSTIDKVNKLCETYDPYIRIFSYDEATSILTWISEDGEITCSANLNAITVESKQNTSDCSITFSTNDGSKTIECDYTGAVASTAITTTTLSAANQIVSLIQSLPKSRSNNQFNNGNEGDEVQPARK